MRQTLPKLAKNAYEVLSSLPKHGVGTKITRNTWQDNSFWTVTQVKTELDGKRGKAYGVLTWRGEQQGEEHTRIRGASKKLWKSLSSTSGNASIGDGMSSAWPSLAAAAVEPAEETPSEATTPDLEGNAESEIETEGATPPPS